MVSLATVDFPFRNSLKVEMKEKLFVFLNKWYVTISLKDHRIFDVTIELADHRDDFAFSFCRFMNEPELERSYRKLNFLQRRHFFQQTDTNFIRFWRKCWSLFFWCLCETKSKLVWFSLFFSVSCSYSISSEIQSAGFVRWSLRTSDWFLLFYWQKQKFYCFSSRSHTE